MNVILLIFLILLGGCKEEQFKNLSIEQIVYDIYSFDYKGVWNNLATPVMISTRNIYEEKEDLYIQTSKNSPEQIRNIIIQECEKLQCKIATNLIQNNKFLIPYTFVEMNINIKIEEVSHFIASLRDQEIKIIEDNFKVYSELTNKIEYYKFIVQNKREILLKVDESTKDTTDITKMKEFEEYKNSLSSEIYTIEKNIEYLESVKGYRNLNIVIEKESTTTTDYIINGISKLLFFISKYMHLFVIVAGLFIIKLIFIILNILFNGLKKLIQRKKNKKTKTEFEERIIEPIL